jgi:hypothetical protein
MKLLTSAALAAILCATAFADDVMNFSLTGVGPDGGTYEGTVVVEELPKEGVGKGDRFQVTWNTGGAPVVGVGVVDGANRNVLAIGYTYNGAAGAAVMLVSNDGKSATGLWAVEGTRGTGTETWTLAGAAADSATPAPASTGGAITYERAVECAAATSYTVGMMRMTPGAFDQAKVDAYDKANSAWIIKLGEVGKDKKMSERIKDTQARQDLFMADPDGLAKATVIADDCVATAPPIE